MVIVNHEGKLYGYVNKHDCWVDPTNKKIQSQDLCQTLKSIALTSGYSDSDFVKPVAELEKYLNKIPVEVSKTPSVKEEKRSASKKSVTAISLGDFIKTQKGE